MFTSAGIFGIAVFLTVGLLGVMALLVVYVARGVKYLQDIAEQSRH